jgi:hypothetical protein
MSPFDLILRVNGTKDPIAAKATDLRLYRRSKVSSVGVDELS